MDKEDLEYALDWTVEWLKNRDNRERIAKAIAMLIDDVNDWMKELD